MGTGVEGVEERGAEYSTQDRPFFSLCILYFLLYFGFNAKITHHGLARACKCCSWGATLYPVSCPREFLSFDL